MRRIEIPLTQAQRRFVHHCLFDQNVGTVGYGGARGPGKTFAHVLVLIMRCLMAPEAQHLVLRRVQRATDLNIGRTARRILRSMEIPVGTLRRGEVQWNDKAKTFLFPNDAMLQLGYCMSDDDWQQYQGIEYATVGFAEATQFPEEAFDKIGGSNRSSSGDLRALRILDCNPGGIGHEWVKRRIIDQKTRDLRTAWVGAKLRDSLATLENDPGYALRVLRPLSDTLRAQWEDGDWDAIEGQFWRIRSGLFAETEVPYWAEVFAGVDPGYWPSAYAALWVAKWNDEDGKPHMHVLSEIKAHKLNLGEQARRSLALESRLQMPVRVRYSDPAAWQRINTDREGAASTAMMWAKHGWVVAAAPKSPRVDGWNLLRMLIDDGVLTISPRCVGLKTEMISAIHAPRSDDMPPSAEDHLQDCLRYVAVSTMGQYGRRPKRKFGDFVSLRNRRPRSRQTMLDGAIA